MTRTPRPWRDFFAAVVEAIRPETPEARAIREREALKRDLRAGRVPAQDETNGGEK
ncbi:hypothetical protein ACFWDN_21390 [Micromonospora chalcea]